MIEWVVSYWWGLVIPLAIALIVGVVKVTFSRRLQISARHHENALEWHSDVRKLFGQIESKGSILTKPRKIDAGRLDGLCDTAVELRTKTAPPPYYVRKHVEHELLGDVRKASLIIYHFVHMPTPQRDADTISGLMSHYIELVNLLGNDTEKEVREIIDQVGSWDPWDDPDVDGVERRVVLEEFQEEAERRLEDWEEMTVAEVMDLPWDRVDDMFSKQDREEFLSGFVDRFAEQVLVEMPREAQSELKNSEESMTG